MHRRWTTPWTAGAAATVSLVTVTVAAWFGPPHTRPDVQFELAGPPLQVGPMAGRPIAADMDGDGDQDIVIACGPCCGREPDAASGHVRVLLNDGRGGLALSGDRIRIGDTALGAAVGDIDHDGALDVVVYQHSSYEATVLRGDGRGGLTPAGSVTMHDGASPHVHAAALGDVNGDGHLDLLATLVDDHALAVLLGDGTGGFAPSLGQPYFAHRHPYMQLNMTDINHDGALDAIMTDMRGGGLTVLVGAGTGMFSPLNGFDLETTMPIASVERPMACTLGDLDQDGDLDAVAFADESRFAVAMINAGGGRFVEANDGRIDLDVPCIGGTLADVTGDGRLDLIGAGVQTSSVPVCVGEADGGFDHAVTVDAGGRSPNAIAVDMNGDGRLDIVTGNYDSGTVSVLINRR